MKTPQEFDVIVAGSGMGGMSAATLLANRGYKVLVLEAAHALGGCSSSYYRQGYWFESGATTLIGFDEHQPLRYLEQQTGIHIPRIELNPSMQIHFNGDVITRHKDREQWIKEAANAFGMPDQQQKFWQLAYDISDTVWKVASKNNFFPPTSLKDLWELVKANSPSDFWVLPYALKSVKDVLQEYRLNIPTFKKFVDEQLMITAQAPSESTPFLFGAAGLTYTNHSNYYVPGGLIKMVHELRDFILGKGGVVKTKTPVENIWKQGQHYIIQTPSESYKAPVVVSNIPVWDMPKITSNELQDYFSAAAGNYKQAWGALTMGVVTENYYPEDMPLHHQLHLDDKSIDGMASQSIFVSMSHPNDDKRTQSGHRVLNISTHTQTEHWFLENSKNYEQRKEKIASEIIEFLDQALPGFNKENIVKIFAATPLTWQNWVYRKNGRVGGIPQSMGRSLIDWMPAETPFPGLFLCGDTVFPGQGIPGVTLSGINSYHRVRRYLK